MKFLKKIIFTFLFLSFVFGSVNFVWADEITSNNSKIELSFFFSPTCPHCAQEKEFLKQIKEKYPQIVINQYNSFEKENMVLLRKFYRDYSVSQEDQGWVPITFVGDKYFVGFNSEIGKKIENCILNYIKEEPCEEDGLQQDSKTSLLPEVSLPFIGKIDVSGFSVLLISVIFGTLDGFNACAMIALGFLLAVLIGTGIRKRVFLIGGTFILVSGLVYFLFMTAWLNLFLVLEQIQFITILVGAVISLFALFLLKDYLHGVVCKLCQINPQKKSLFSKLEQGLLLKMKNLLESDLSLPLILLGVAVVAAGINLVELVCSFGFPVAFTKILTTRAISTSSYYFYILVYIFFYMLDDMLVFTLAIVTLRLTQMSEKYLKAIKLISGMVLLALGVIMIFFPHLLAF